MDFAVYIFDIPADNIDKLEDLWRKLYAKPLRFNDYEAFSDNSFSIGFGQPQTREEIRGLLRAAGGRQIETISLLLSDDEPVDLTISYLDKEQTVFYKPAGSSMEGATLGPGTLSLRVKAKKLLQTRGVCDFKAQPVFTPPQSRYVRQMPDARVQGEYVFVFAEFGLCMAPGDFFVLGPAKYVPNQITLGGIFFSRPDTKPVPVAQVFVFVCASVMD